MKYIIFFILLIGTAKAQIIKIDDSTSIILEPPNPFLVHPILRFPQPFEDEDLFVKKSEYNNLLNEIADLKREIECIKKLLNGIEHPHININTVGEIVGVVNDNMPIRGGLIELNWGPTYCFDKLPLRYNRWVETAPKQEAIMIGDAWGNIQFGHFCMEGISWGTTDTASRQIEWRQDVKPLR